MEPRRPSAIQLMAAISSTPGVEQLAERAHEQMLRACRDMNRDYPQMGGAPAVAPSELDLEALLERGTSDEESARRVAALALIGTMRRWPESPDGVANLARDLFWLESESKLPVLSLAAIVLDDPLKSQLALQLHRLATTSGASRGQKCLAQLWSEALAGDADSLRAVLDGSVGELPAAATPARAARTAIRGRVLTTPRGPLVTAVAAFSGWMLIRHLAAYVSRYVLAYRAQAELSVSERGIEIHEQTSMLGRKLRDRTRLISLQTIRSLSREVRYARAGTYAGLAALALGSFVGMRLFVDGIRAPGFSGPTMLVGLLVVVLGLTLDFACANWLNVSRAHCRLLIETVRGRGLYLTCEEPTKVDGMLVDLANRLTA